MSLNGLAGLLLPPASLVPLALLGVALRRCRLAGAALALLLVLGLPATADLLLAGLERRIPPPPLGASADAIIVLGGTVGHAAAPPGEAARTELGSLSLERVRAGAALARATGLPVLVSGGVVGDEGPPVAALMAQSLREDFGLTARWVESGSRDTWENATASAAMLRPAGITNVYVVTHAWHMPRALLAFAAAGLTAIPAPLAREAWPRLRADEFWPQTAAWQRSYYALHEWIGWGWYGLRAWHER